MSAVSGEDVVDSPALLTAGWLSAALDTEVNAVSWTRVGSGQIGACYRLELSTPAGSRRMIAKLAAEDPASRAFLGPAYRAEVRFYREIAGTVAIRTPRCHYSAIAEDGATFVLLLDDAAPAVQGDQLGGCAPEQAADAVVNLAGLHGPRWCDPRLLELPWLAAVTEEDGRLLGEVFAPAVETFVERFAGELSDADVATLRQVAGKVASWVVGRPERFGLVHGDYRLDNLLFPPDGAPGVMAVDWQTLSLGHPVRDLAFFLGTSLEPRVRAGSEEALVARYHRALTGHGVRDYTLAECFDDYRFAALQGPLITVLGCAYGTRTDRGDAMFLTMARRSLTMIRDLGGLELV